MLFYIYYQMYFIPEESCHFTDRACRLCLSVKSSTINVFKSFANNGSNLAKILNDIIGMNAKPDDELPGNVCFDCLDDIRRYCKINYTQWSTLCYLIQMNNEKEKFDLNEMEMPKDNIEFLLRKNGSDLNVESTQSEAIHSNSGSETSEDDGFQVQYCWCNECNEDFISVEDLRVHLEVHRENRLCSKYTEANTTSDREVAKNLFVSKSNRSENKLCCARCDEVFKSVEGLSIHVDRYDFKCKPAENENSYDSSLDLRIVSDDEIEFYHHRRKGTSYSGDKSGNCAENAPGIHKTLDGDTSVHQSAGSESLSEAIEQVPSFLCAYCERIHDNKKILRNHIVQCHLSFNKQHCPKCFEVFAYSEDLEKHCNSHSSDEKFFCSVCKNGFISREVLIEHMNESHEPERVFLCSVCRNGFKSRTELGVHHSRNVCAKEYSCSNCFQRFLSRNAFNVHLRICHLKSAPFTCDICDKALSTKNNLQAHKLVHANVKPFQCHLCLKFFSGSGQRYAHVRAVHMKIKPYECGICNKKFSFKGNLKTHYIVHSDQRPYKCIVCEKSFKHKFYLTVHAKNHYKK